MDSSLIYERALLPIATCYDDDQTQKDEIASLAVLARDDMLLSSRGRSPKRSLVMECLDFFASDDR